MAQTESQGAAPAGEFRRGWPIVAASIIGIYASLATLPFYAIQGLILPLEAAFGWDRGQVSFAITLMGIGNLLTSYASGVLADRFGSRPVALVSGLLLAAALFLITLNGGNLSLFLAGYFLATIVGVGTLPLTYTRTVSQWFDRSRGLALGLTLMGTSLAAFSLPRLYAWGVAHWGWQGVFYVAIGLILCLWLPVFLLAFRDRPKAEQAANQALLTGMEPGAAALTPTFWKMGVAFFLVTCAMSGIVIHFIAMVRDNGVPAEQAAGLAGVIGLSLLAARLSVGWLIDRFHAPPIAALCFAVPAIGCWLLTGGGHGSALVAAIMVGVALGAELDLIAFFTGRYFGMRNYGKIYGWQYVFYTVGAGISPYVFGLVYIRFKSYDPALWASVGALLIAALLMLWLPRYERAPHGAA